MERESNPMQALCRSGCGFYGSPATDGLCSLCYKEALKKKQQPPSSSGGGGSPASAGPASGLAASLIDTAQPTCPVIAPASVPAASVDACKDTRYGGSLRRADRNYPAASEARPLALKRMKTADAEGAVGGSSAENSVSSGEAEEGFDNKDSDKEAKKKKNRCAVCRKKVGLTGFECRCGGLFCAVHRYSDKHQCTFDYREMGAQEIRRNNPVVVGEKIQKI